MKLTEIIAPGAVQPRLQATTRDGAIAELVDLLVRAGAAPARLRDALLQSALDRERRGSTGFGKGVAVPHVKHPEARRVSLALGIAPTGIDFNALDKQPVYSVFLLLSPADLPEEHLKAMEVIFKNLSYDAFRRKLRQVETPQEALELLREADAPKAPG